MKCGPAFPHDVSRCKRASITRYFRDRVETEKCVVAFDVGFLHLESINSDSRLSSVEFAAIPTSHGVADERGRINDGCSGAVSRRDGCIGPRVMRRDVTLSDRLEGHWRRGAIKDLSPHNETVSRCLIHPFIPEYSPFTSYKTLHYITQGNAVIGPDCISSASELGAGP